MQPSNINNDYKKFHMWEFKIVLIIWYIFLWKIFFIGTGVSIIFFISFLPWAGNLDLILMNEMEISFAIRGFQFWWCFQGQTFPYSGLPNCTITIETWLRTQRFIKSLSSIYITSYAIVNSVVGSYIYNM